MWTSAATHTKFLAHKSAFLQLHLNVLQIHVCKIPVQFFRWSDFMLSNILKGVVKFMNLWEIMKFINNFQEALPCMQYKKLFFIAGAVFIKSKNVWWAIVHSSADEHMCETDGAWWISCCFFFLCPEESFASPHSCWYKTMIDLWLVIFGV